MLKKIIAISLVILVLFFIGGCKSDAEKIESEEEVQENVVNISEDISDITDILESIEEDLS